MEERTIIEGRVGALSAGDSFPVRIMGVINLTGDSFYSGSISTNIEQVKAEARRMESEGADVIDLGARSTAPYKQFDIPVSEEERLLGDAVSAVSTAVKIPVSADTTRLRPARRALECGASILNHVYGVQGAGSDEISRLVAKSGCNLILTAHEPGQFEDNSGKRPIERVSFALSNSLHFCKSYGVKEENIIIDPGIGFFKDQRISNVDWNASVLAELEELRSFRLPICVGLSRKRFLGQLLGGKSPEERLNASNAANSIAVYNGAHIIRTHDVKETREACIIAKAIREKRFIRSSLYPEKYNSR